MVGGTLDALWVLLNPFERTDAPRLSINVAFIVIVYLFIVVVIVVVPKITLRPI